MAGPVSRRQALPWIREAVRGGRYVVHPVHFGKRCRERGLNIDDVRHAVEHARACDDYAGRATTQEGTNWRVTGPSVDGEQMAVGVEAYEVGQDQWVLLITLFEV